MFTGRVWGVIVAHGGSTGQYRGQLRDVQHGGPFRSDTLSGTVTASWWGTRTTSLTVSHSSDLREISSGAWMSGSGGNAGLATGATITFWDNLLDISQSSSSAAAVKDSADGQRWQHRLQQHRLRPGE